MAMPRPDIDFLKRPLRLYIDGQWVETDSYFETSDPATGDVLADVPRAGVEHVDAAVLAARRALDGAWKDTSPVARERLMHRLADLIDEHFEELALLEVLDNGKLLQESRGVDIALSAGLMRYFAGWPTKLKGDILPNSVPGMLSLKKREPVGVVGAIAPWNFPLLEILYKIGPALAAGCTVVGKPASWTPLSTLRFAELVEEAGFPPGVINIVTGPGREIGGAIASHPGIDKVAFTGQTETGVEILRNSAGNLKKVSLELGGKSPNIVFADANLDAAMAGAFGGAFFNQGQACVAGTRLFVESSIADEFSERLASKAAEIRLGEGLDPESEMGPLVSSAHRSDVGRHVEIAREEGARVMVGGGDVVVEGLERGTFFAPTVIDGVDNSMHVAQEEIFGPVVTIIRWDDVSELVEKANDIKYGLAAGIWTQDVNKALKLADAINAGTVWINTYGMFDAAVPFGGHKMSGYGRELGEEALDPYLQSKSIWVDLDVSIPTSGQSVAR